MRQKRLGSGELPRNKGEASGASRTGNIRVGKPPGIKSNQDGGSVTNEGGEGQILKRRGDHARREAEKTKAWGMPWDHDVAAARWKEDIEEVRSVSAGTYPKVAGLEDEELEKRKEKFAVAPLGNLTYERQEATFRFIMNQVDNLSTWRTRDIKICQLTDLGN